MKTTKDFIFIYNDYFCKYLSACANQQFHVRLEIIILWPSKPMNFFCHYVVEDRCFKQENAESVIFRVQTPHLG